MSDGSESDRTSRVAWIAMSVILLALLVVAVYANWRNAHRDRFESTTVTRYALPFSPSASPTP